VHDTAGRLVRVLRDAGTLPAGPYRLAWDGQDHSGSRAAAGVYFLRLETADRIASEPVVLLR
jgi:YD repeat-containing protein